MFRIADEMTIKWMAIHYQQSFKTPEFKKKKSEKKFFSLSDNLPETTKVRNQLESSWKLTKQPLESPVIIRM